MDGDPRESHNCIDFEPRPSTIPFEIDGGRNTVPSQLKLLAQLDIPGNWSGKGQHVVFEQDEAIPLEQGPFLGRGAFADVYEVKCRGISIARKQIFCTRRLKIEDLKREIDVLKKLNHKHIINLLGSYKQGIILGLLLHPVAICDLRKLLDELDENQTPCVDFSNDFETLMDRLGFQENISGLRERLNRLYGCLANAIQYLHDNDIRHKDIKPQNILLGQNDDLYVTDFGISRDTADASSSITDGDARGTYRYCAPEVASYNPRGRAADIFSLGCVFLEINTVYRQLSLGVFENFRIENDDRSYQNSPQKLQAWMFKLRQIRTGDAGYGIFDIVDIIGKMVSPTAKDRPVIDDVCLSLRLLGDVVYFGKCCPSQRYQNEQTQATELAASQERLYESVNINLKLTDDIKKLSYEKSTLEKTTSESRERFQGEHEYVKRLQAEMRSQERRFFDRSITVPMLNQHLMPRSSY
ncbi:kinase-like protein [Hyaloscypha variabilis]